MFLGLFLVNTLGYLLSSVCRHPVISHLLLASTKLFGAIGLAFAVPFAVWSVSLFSKVGWNVSKMGLNPTKVGRVLRFISLPDVEFFVTTFLKSVQYILEMDNWMHGSRRLAVVEHNNFPRKNSVFQTAMAMTSQLYGAFMTVLWIAFCAFMFVFMFVSVLYCGLFFNPAFLFFMIHAQRILFYFIYYCMVPRPFTPPSGRGEVRSSFVVLRGDRRVQDYNHNSKCVIPEVRLQSDPK